MQVDNDELRNLCTQLNHLFENTNLTITDRCEFTGLFSGLASVQSFFDQINELVTGHHGLKKLVKWHLEEGRCVSTALKNQCRATCLTDTSTQGDLNGTYDNLASKQKHKACLPQDMGGLGHGVKLPDGRLMRSFSSRGIPLTEEPLGQDVDRLAAEFAKFDSSVFYECAGAWQTASETLVTLADDLQKIANDVEGAGSNDAYTHEAGSGMRRWASSLRQLGKQAHTVSTRIDTFAKNYDYARIEVNAVADESDRAKRNATEERPYDPAVYMEKASAVLRDHYNPELVHADTRNIEVPVPIRAFHRDDMVRLPAPPKPAPAAPVSVCDLPPIAANPDGVMSAPTQPVAPPPDTKDIRKVTPREGMPPAETTPNMVGPLSPGQGSTIGSVGGPTGMTPGGAPSPVAPAGTNAAAAGPAGMQTSQPNAGYMGGYPGRWTNPNHGTGDNRESRPNTSVLVGGGAFGAGLGAGSVGRTGSMPGTSGIASGMGAKGAGIASTNPNTPTGSSAKTPTNAGSSVKGAGTPGTGAGRPGMGGMPGAPGAAASQGTTNKSKRRRPRRSAENTERILPQPGNLPRGIIRHPDDPLYGTGR